MNPDYERAREEAVRYIGIDRRKSSGKVRDKLLRCLYDEDTIEDVLAYLRSIHYLDDRRAGRKIIEKHSGRYQKSRYAVFTILLRQGVEQSIAECLIQELPSDRVTALELFSIMRNNSDYTAEKLIRFLTGRGYSRELASSIVLEYWQDET